MPDAWDALGLKIASRALTPCDLSWACAGRRLHNNPFSRIYWLRNGVAEIRHDGRLHRLERGHLHVIPAHSPGLYRCIEEMDLYWCHFNATLFGGMEVFDYIKTPLDIELPKDEWRGMDRLWKEFVALDMDKSPQGRFRSVGLLSLLLSKIFATAREEDIERRRLAYERLSPVLEFMERRLAEKIKLSELAAIVHLQENYFSLLFKEAFGVSPMSYLLRLRVREAQILLKSGETPLKEIALRCGFGSQFHFSAAFRRQADIPPGAYRSADPGETP
jgi:AraC-like DNA-binding protein